MISLSPLRRRAIAERRAHRAAVPSCSAQPFVQRDDAPPVASVDSRRPSSQPDAPRPEPPISVLATAAPEPAAPAFLPSFLQSSRMDELISARRALEQQRADLAASLASASSGASLQPPAGSSRPRPSGEPSAAVSKRARASNPEAAPEAPRAAFVPFARWAPVCGSIVQKARAANAQAGTRLRLIGPVQHVPAGFMPRVHGRAAVPKELARRLVEAERMIASLPPARWSAILDVPVCELHAWPAPRLMQSMIDAYCAIAGHERLADMRTVLCRLDDMMVAQWDWSPRDILRRRVGASTMKDFLFLVQDEAALRDWKAEQRRAAAQPELARAAEAEASEERKEGGASARALGLLKLAAASLHLDFAVHDPQLVQFSHRPPTRETSSSATPEISTVVHLQLIASDSAHGEFVCGAAALAVLEAADDVRQALMKRSDPPELAANGMAVSSGGMDLKKRKWCVAGRPLICSVRAYTGDPAWFSVASSVLAKDGFGKENHSLLRAHNGPSGDVTRATAWLDREPSRNEWTATLRTLLALEARAPDASGRMQRVVPHLVRLPSGVIPNVTPHALKRVKNSAYAAVRIDSAYLVEAGGHAGSQIERMSVALMRQQISEIRPAGLRVAMRYARGCSNLSVAAVDHMVFEALRTYIASVGLAGLPRERSWDAFATWALNAPDESRALYEPKA